MAPRDRRHDPRTLNFGAELRRALILDRTSPKPLRWADSELAGRERDKPVKVSQASPGGRPMAYVGGELIALIDIVHLLDTGDWPRDPDGHPGALYPTRFYDWGDLEHQNYEVLADAEERAAWARDYRDYHAATPDTAESGSHTGDSASPAPDTPENRDAAHGGSPALSEGPTFSTTRRTA